MKLKLVFLSLFILLLLFTSCENKIKTLTTEVDKIASEINALCVTTRDDTIKLAEEVKKILLTRDTVSKEEIEKADVSEGGKFKVTQGYYLNDKDYGSGVVCGWMNTKTSSPLPSDLVIQEMILMDTKIAGLMNDFFKTHDYCKAMSYLHYAPDITLQLLLPYQDALSGVPEKDVLMAAVGGSLRVLPQFGIITKKNNPEKTYKWIPELYLHQILGIVSVTASVPIFLNETEEDADRTIVSQIAVESLSNKILSEEKGLYLALTPGGNPIGMSKVAQNTFGLKMPTFDMVTENKISKLGDTFKLQSYDDPGLKLLVEKITAGEKQFEVTIKNIKYTAVISDIPEIKAKAAGLVKK